MEQIDLFEAGVLEWPEEWRPVKGWEGWYEVSNKGRVRSLNYNHSYGKSRVLKPEKTKDGYMFVNLCRKYHQKHVSVHRLVAIAFIPNTGNLPVINHKDENPSNNHVENLEWCTTSYNNKYGTRPIRYGRKRGKPVKQYDLDGNFIQEFYSTRLAARTVGVSHKHIMECCNGFLKTSAGYIWRYAE